MGKSLYARDTFRRLVLRIARVVGSAERAEDLLQAAFVRLEERRGREAILNPEGFLVRVATNLAIDQRRRERVLRLDARSVGDFASIADGHPLQDEVLEAQERLARVRRTLATLTPRTRSIFLMHRVDGLKYREIAFRFGITVSAVEKHIAKAVLALSNELG